MPILNDIIAYKKEWLKSLTIDTSLLKKNERSFLDACTTGATPRVIAELKAKSPSEGVIDPDYDPKSIAQAYIEGGAAALSVLTDEHFFNGNLTDLDKVRAVTDLPLLCKDFIIDRKQVQAARLHGANACLLIVRILNLTEAKTLKAEIEALGMLAVIEVFDENDLAIALQLNPKILLINNRNLDTLSMNQGNAPALVDLVPDRIPVIAASGFKTPDEIKALPTRFCAVLVGTSLMRASDKVGFLSQLYAH